MNAVFAVMNRQLRRKYRFATLAIGGLIFGASVLHAVLIEANDSELSKPASWQVPSIRDLDGPFKEYLETRQLPPVQREKVDSFWSGVASLPSGPPLLEHLIRSLGLADDRFNQVLDGANGQATAASSAADLSWMGSDVPAWVQANVMLFVGREMAQAQLYDEALRILSGIDLASVADPSTLLFYRALCHHHLLQKDECLKDLRQLLERESELPSRYAITAKLLLSDIEPLEVDSLDEISRLMNDVQRRLDLGRSGKTVRDQEQQIVDKLDKMIEKIEEQIQQQQQRQQQQQQGGKDDPNQGQGKPMEDSRIAGTNGPGDVDPKDIGKKSGWGDLPPAQRQEALQNITKDLPSHYREVIEAYFKTLATDQR